MARAELGDDVFGEDRTVRALEARAAELLGKEDGLFVASGTMGNLVALLALTTPGQILICGREHHLVLSEFSGYAVLANLALRGLQDGTDGTLDQHELSSAFEQEAARRDGTVGLVAIENTHLSSMGQPLTASFIRAIGEIVHAHSAFLHIDGARFWNAVVALGVSPVDLAEAGDTVSFCLSKGLCCPIGAVVVGSRDVMSRARHARRLLGGGMRQAGIVAAAGLVALSDGPDGLVSRLADDHANARLLADALSTMKGVVAAGGTAQPTPGPLDPARVRTNILLFKVNGDRDFFLRALRAHGILMLPYPHEQIRAVTHHGITAHDIRRTIDAVASALAETVTLSGQESARTRPGGLLACPATTGQSDG
jgi:threonine aldolase